MIHVSYYISIYIFFLLFQLSSDPTYSEIKKPQHSSLQYDEVPLPAAVHPHSTDDDQPPPIPLFCIEDEPFVSPNGPVIAQYSVIRREHMTSNHVPPCSAVVEGYDPTQSMSKREETKVIEQLSSFILQCCYCSRVEKTFICSTIKILMFLQL